MSEPVIQDVSKFVHPITCEKCGKTRETTYPYSECNCESKPVVDTSGNTDIKIKSNEPFVVKLPKTLLKIGAVEPYTIDPAETDLKDPLFNLIWEAIKQWDLQRRQGEGYAGATGTDVMTVLSAIRPFIASQVAEIKELRELLEQPRKIDNVKFCKCGNVFFFDEDYDSCGSDSGCCCPDCGDEQFKAIADLKAENERLKLELDNAQDDIASLERN
jgi:hypothetical protein